MTRQAVILAGGLATRMQPHTRDVPKSLLPVAGKPFLAWQLAALAGSGYSDVLLLTGHLGEQIRSFVGDGTGFGLRARFSEDGPRLLGTGGALRKALPLLGSEFLVTYGDSYLPFDYKAPLDDLRAHPEALGTMAVYENQGRWDKSNTCVEGELVSRYDKGAPAGVPEFRFIDYGATALRRRALETLPEDTTIGLDALQGELSRRGELRAYVARERFYEIGSPTGLAELEAYLLGSVHP